MGLWMRPRYYGANGSDASSAGIQEARRTRSVGGVFDASTLGKIEVAGKDAAAFVDRLYLNPMSTLRVNRAKYGVLLREDGMVLDDGIVLRTAEDRYIATTSSGHAGQILAHFEFWRDREFARRDVAIADITEAWSTIVVAGPSSRQHLADLLGPSWKPDICELAHMRFATGRWNAAALRILRASFSGELAFELHCHPAAAADLWKCLITAGLSPYGMEAVDILRLEKGYLVSSELNGQTSPHDLGMDALLASGNPCIGRELLERPGLHEPARPRLVGVKSDAKGHRFLGGAQLVEEQGGAHPCGYVTSSAFSPALDDWIGLALVARRIPEGSHLIARDPLRNLETPVRVTDVVHFDPSGERMKS
jgi:sarcosine oxidase subunit alpha